MAIYPWAETAAAAGKVAAQYGMHPKLLLAIGEIESRNDPGPKGQPIIRLEPHWFRKKATPAQYAKAKARGLLKNPRSQDARWKQYAQLRAIAANAAHLSHSFGIGQVMGFNHEMLGYRSAQELAVDAARGPEAQYRMMAEFIKRRGILDELKRGDYIKFAIAYNGPKHAQNRYVPKLIAAIKKHENTITTPVGPTPVPPTPTQPGSPWPAIVGVIIAIGAFVAKILGVF